MSPVGAEFALKFVKIRKETKKYTSPTVPAKLYVWMCAGSDLIFACSIPHLAPVRQRRRTQFTSLHPRIRRLYNLFKVEANVKPLARFMTYEYRYYCDR